MIDVGTGAAVPVQQDTATLSAEEWLGVADDLLSVGPIIQKVLADTQREHPDMTDLCPALDPEIFEANMRLAAVAAVYVAQFAADKCQFGIQEEEQQ